MDRIRLRALTISDLPLTLEWHNQSDIVDMYSGHPFPVNEEMERQWYEKILYSNVPSSVFGIELLAESKLVGITILRDINYINRSAETAIYIGDPEARGRGLSSEAIRLMLDFGFNKLGLHRIWLRVRLDNTTALKLYYSSGFALEGALRQSIYKNGEFFDEQVLSILSNEYREIYSDPHK